MHTSSCSHKKKRSSRTIGLFFLLMPASLFSQEHLRLPALFTDNMVLQRGLPIPFWGTASPGEQLCISMAGEKTYTTAGSNGEWMVRLPSLNEGGPYEVTISGKDTLVLDNVVIGDVWLASGQSNMEMPVSPNQWFTGVKDYRQVVDHSDDPMLRVFTVTKNASMDTLLDDVAGEWRSASKENTGGFTAAGYFFARKLRKELNVPIGIISTSWGASSAQAWVSTAALSASPALQPIMEDWQKIRNKYTQETIRFEKEMAAWQTNATTKPAAPSLPVVPQKRPSALYNGMIAPLIPYAIKGVIWYQGEGNTDKPEQYRELFSTLITNWRQDWKQQELPFLFVQLPGYKKIQVSPSEDGWAALREVQSKTLRLPNTCMAVTIDLGEEKDIHPKNKQDVGYRLSLCALARVYEQKIAYTGPRFKSMKRKGHAIQLKFDTKSGLRPAGGELKGFAIAGADSNFVWADATLHGKTIIVSSPQVAIPVAVRYAWANNPVGNLYNGAGLPASPFRTDNWPVKGLRL